jgi:hypothetical protein
MIGIRLFLFVSADIGLEVKQSTLELTATQASK